MAEGGAELSVVCPSCGAEVSPYVTECPYCGGRVRKRAPKIGSREDPANIAKRRRSKERRAERSAGRRAARESAGDALLKPVVAPTLVAVAVVISAMARASLIRSGKLIPLADLEGEGWKVLTAPFVNLDVGYAFVVLAAFALYGSWLERALGRLSAAVAWFGAGAAAVWVASLAGPEPAAGALAAATTVTVARAFAALEARRDGEDQDLVGVAVVLVVIAVMPAFVNGASWYALAVGLAVGLLAGSLAVVRQRSERGR